MINIAHVLEACEVRKQLTVQASIIAMFIFENQPPVGDLNSARIYLYAEIDGPSEIQLEIRAALLLHSQRMVAQ
jgi:hypothetical protein